MDLRTCSHLPGSARSPAGFAVTFQSCCVLWLRDLVEHNSCSALRIPTVIGTSQINIINKRCPTARHFSALPTEHGYLEVCFFRVLNFKLEVDLTFLPLILFFKPQFVYFPWANDPLHRSVRCGNTLALWDRKRVTLKAYWVELVFLIVYLHKPKSILI